MDRAHLSLVAFCLALAGCANLSTVQRATALPGDGMAVHLDAPQRVSIANNKGWVCSEPSPDALQAYASSLGLGFGRPNAESVSIAQALSANAGSIGLRTQSITLMRDALFRICELYFNGAISKEAAIQLLQRSQDLTLGVLAIEQLTGAVVAQQVVLTGSSAASAAATINDSQREIDRARADEAAKKKASESADRALEAQTKTVGDKKASADAAKQKAAGTQKLIDDLAPQLTKAKQEYASAQSARAGSDLKVRALDVVVAKPIADKKKLEEELKPLHATTEAAKQAHDEAGTAKKGEDEIKELKAKWDDAAAKEKPVADKLKLSQDKVDSLQAQIADEKKTLEKAKAEEEKAATTLAPLQAQMDIAKKDPDIVASDKAAAELKAATEDQDKKKTAANDAKNAYEEAQTNTLAVEKLGSTAITNAGASTSGSGQFSTAVTRPAMTKDTVDILTKGTVKIVETVMNKGHVTDTCGVLLMTQGATMDESLMTLCAKVVLGALQIWQEDARVKIAKCKDDKNCSDSSIEPYAINIPGTTFELDPHITPLMKNLYKKQDTEKKGG